MSQTFSLDEVQNQPVSGVNGCVEWLHPSTPNPEPQGILGLSTGTAPVGVTDAAFISSKTNGGF